MCRRLCPCLNSYAGGNPNEKETEEHWPPLLEAASKDHVEAARLLLDAGADMYVPTNGGETPLLMAVQCGSVGVLRLLVERGCQMNADIDKAAWMLTQAARGGHVEIVRWLLAQGIDVDATDTSGRTALTCAAANDRLEMVEALLRAGANVNHRDNDTETVLMWAADHADNADVLHALIQAGADVNLKNDFDHTALSWVMRHGDREMMLALLDAGADIGSDALIRAAYKGLTEAVCLLLERGADLATTGSGGKSALDYARQQGHREIANLLLQAEADQQLRGSGKTFPPPRYPTGTRVCTLSGTFRKGWIVLAVWHHKYGDYGYIIEVEGKSQARKNVSKRYWAEDLQAIEDEPEPISQPLTTQATE